jgi:hypothetical protein
MKTLNLKELEIDFNDVVDNKIKNILFLKKKFNKNKIKLLVLNNKTRKYLSLFYFSKKKGNQNSKNFDAN